MDHVLLIFGNLYFLAPLIVIPVMCVSGYCLNENLLIFFQYKTSICGVFHEIFDDYDLGCNCYCGSSSCEPVVESYSDNYASSSGQYNDETPGTVDDTTSPSNLSAVGIILISISGVIILSVVIALIVFAILKYKKHKEYDTLGGD